MEKDPVSVVDQLDDLLDRLERADPIGAVTPAEQLAVALERELDPE